MKSVTWKEFRDNVDESLRLAGKDPDATSVVFRRIDVVTNEDYSVRVSPQSDGRTVHLEVVGENAEARDEVV